MKQVLKKCWALQSLLLAVIYYGTGYLGGLFALPPGYASLVWPPMGISIAALLLCGKRLWPGVALGAFLIGTQNLGDPSRAHISFFMAVGNTLAVLFGVLLVQRLIKFPRKFYSEKEIILFLILVGPIASLISATIGIEALVRFEEIPRSHSFNNWMHWYVGDATGAILFAPIALMLSVKSRELWLKSITKVFIPIFLSFGLVLFVLHYLNKNERVKMTSDFHNKAEITFETFRKNLASNVDMLSALQGFFSNSTEVTEQEFKNFSKILSSQHNEVKALAWISIGKLRPLNYEIKFTEPELETRDFFGLNDKAPKESGGLVEKTLSSVGVVASGAIKLTDLDHGEKGILLLMATSDPHIGVLAQILSLDQLMKDVVGLLNDPSYRFLLEDISGEKAEILINTTLSQAGSAGSNHFTAEFKWADTLSVGERRWRVSIQQDPALREGHYFQTFLFLITTLVFIILMCSLLLIVANRIITVQEIVEEKTQYLKELNTKLQKASQTKSEFLANMSHEIRTPLNVIIGMSDLMEESPLNSEQQRYLEISKKAGHNLLNIVSDILDISKIEAGLITLEKVEIDLSEILKEVQDMFMLAAEEKGLQISLSIDEKVKNIYLGDPTRIRQVLSNLVGNATKFTSEGEIVIEVTENTGTDLNGNILFRVRDTGIGISAEKIGQLFKPFTQADSTITRKFGGTGLGLSISKRLVSMMNGEIKVESELGVGSVFSFSLELPCVRKEVNSDGNKLKTDVPKSEVGESASDSVLSILLVDDTEDNRTLIRAFFRKTPHKLVEARSGLEALELAKEVKPDLILMDMQMPVMDGFTATQRIREWEKQAGQEPAAIWAVTAYALNEEVERSLRAGCNMHLIKPIRKAKLLDYVQRLARERGSSPQKRQAHRSQ